MTYDNSVPTKLKNTQQWFASIITRPIDNNSRMNPVGPSGRDMTQEAADYIAPSPTLKPDQRIQIYNQQYWWRLLTVMHDNFPTVTRLFGYHEFNQIIGIPYLLKYPPDHWSLNHLGDQLPRWIEEDYSANDKLLVSHAAAIDHAFYTSFIAPQHQGVSLDNLPIPGDFSSLLNQELTLQSHVYLFELPYDLFQFRMEFMKQDPDYWVDNDFPELVHQLQGKNLHFILYRDRLNNIVVEKISSSEQQLLKKFRSGTSIEKVCEWLEQQPENSEVVIESSQKLQEWIQRWIAYNIFQIL